MKESMPTLTRYGDLVGTVEIDGHITTPLDDLAELTDMPTQYCPVGLEIELFDSFDAIIYFAVLAYDSRIVGCGPTEMGAYVERHGTLPVRRFKGLLRSSMAHRFFKHFSIVALDSRSVHVGDRLRVETDKNAPLLTSTNRAIAKAKPR